jgi:hypothetical protein
MATDIPRLERPIDVMYVIHYALRAEAARVETLVGQLEEGGSLQPVRRIVGMATGGWAHTPMRSSSPFPLQDFPRRYKGLPAMWGVSQI